LHLNFLPGVPPSRIEEVPEERIALIHDNHFAGKPKASIMLRMALCSTVSKAFAKSSFRITISLLLC
jgi:hypothetical protein